MIRPFGNPKTLCDGVTRRDLLHLGRHFAHGWAPHSHHYPRLKEVLLPAFDHSFPAFRPAIEGRRLLDAADKAAGDDGVAKQRVVFLENGLRHAELTLAAETAHRRGAGAEVKRAGGHLDAFRARHATGDTAKLGTPTPGDQPPWDRGGGQRGRRGNAGEHQDSGNEALHGHVNGW